MGRPVLPALLAVALVVAGCNAFPTGTERGEPTRTVTPVPVTDGTDATSVSPGPDTSLPSGIRRDGTVNLTEVIRAHNDLLAGHSYTVTYDFPLFETGPRDRRVFTNGTVTLVVANETTFMIRTRDRTDETTDLSYFDGTGQYTRTVEHGTVRTVIESDDSTRRDRALSPGILDIGAGPLVLPPEDVTVSSVVVGGDRFYRIHVPAKPSGYGWDYQRNYTATLYVTPDGLVRSLYLEVVSLHGDGGPRVRQLRVTFTDVGTATLSEPEWVSVLEENRTATADSTVAPPAGNATTTPT